MLQRENQKLLEHAPKWLRVPKLQHVFFGENTLILFALQNEKVFYPTKFLQS